MSSVVGKQAKQVENMGYNYIPVKNLISIAGMSKIQQYGKRIKTAKKKIEEQKNINIFRLMFREYEENYINSEDDYVKQVYKISINELGRQLEVLNDEVKKEMVPIMKNIYIEEFGMFLTVTKNHIK